MKYGKGYGVSMTLSSAIITLDGPAAVGKGTLARLVAQNLGWHYLDSGALYRTIAYLAQMMSVAWDDEPTLLALLPRCSVRFVGEQVWLEGREINAEIRSEAIGEGASRLAQLHTLRQRLLEIQHAFAQPPGLVAEGRDMGTVVFPDALLKCFLTASAEVRAQRRVAQLQTQNKPANYDEILLTLRARDVRDSTRVISPLHAAQDAVVLDTDKHSPTELAEKIIAMWRGVGGMV